MKRLYIPAAWERNRLRWVNGIGLSVLALALLFSLYPQPLETLGHLGTLCMFKRITHWPCPTCGITRAMLALGRGDWGEAFRYNILAPLSVAGILALAFLSVFRMEASLWVLRQAGARAGLLVLLGMLALAWVLKFILPAAYW